MADDKRLSSILDTTKKKLGLIPDVTTEFDSDIIDCINTALNILTQFGIGPVEGFVIEGKDETWQDFLGDDNRFDLARSYVLARARIIFDPPQSSYVLSSLQEQIKEYEYRLNMFAECTETFPR